jgi:hypothetical protein
LTDVYIRQQELNLHIPTRVAVCGLGGIGSWVALDLALVGVPELVLIDPDALEPHNLNRTPYTFTQVGSLKVQAIAQLIAERRPACTLILFPYMYQEVAELLPPEIEWFVDCTDALVVKRLAAGQRGWRYMKLGYDGFGFTIDMQTTLPWEEEPPGYRIVPSFVGTPQFLAALAVTIIVSNARGPLLVSGDLREVI